MTGAYQLRQEQIAIIHKGRRGSPMDMERLQNIVDNAISDAEEFVDDTLAPAREEATKYFYGQPMGTEVAGRSSIVMTEVRDVVNTLIPGIMRVFTGNEHVVEFAPKEKADVENAEQATDYVDHIFSVDNPGFNIIYDLAIDGLVKRSGIITWWYEEKVEVQEEEYQGLTIGQVAMLAQDPDVEIIDIEELQPGQPSQNY